MRIIIWIMLGLYSVGAILALGLNRRPRVANLVGNIFSILAALAGIGSGITVLFAKFSEVAIANITTSVPLITLTLAVDRLSCFFLLALSLLVLAVSIYSCGYLKHYYQKFQIGLFNFLYNVFILTMVLVLISKNMIGFLIAWELMTICSYFLVVFESHEAANRRAGTIYLIMTHLATVFLTFAFLAIYHYSGSWQIGAHLSQMPIYLKNILFIALLLGFGTKAGIIPLHIWLPYAHPAAPSNVSALMSGMMIKTAIYGLIRFVLGVLGPAYEWWGIVVLIIGVISTVLGVAYALMEHNMKRLLAYHSIENIGIILIGFGMALWATAVGAKSISAIALLAALFHLLNHTVFKGALFLSAGAVHYATGTKDMEKLGGLLKKMPYTGLFFLIGALAISALPPFNGFVSEWLTYQALFLGILTIGSGGKILALLAMAGLALAGALAATCFVKFFGITFLGLPRSQAATKAAEAPRTMLWGMGLLAAVCLVLGVWPALMVQSLNKLVADWTGVAVGNSLSGHSFLIYRPLMVAQSSVSQFWLLIIGVILLVAVLAAVKIGTRRTAARNYTTWDCGYPSLNPRMQYSATGFTKPLRIVFRALYQPSRELQLEEGSSPYQTKMLRYQVATESIFEKYLYRPLVVKFTKTTRNLRLKVQTGSVHAYLFYIFLAMLVLFGYFILN